MGSTLRAASGAHHFSRLLGCPAGPSQATVLSWMSAGPPHWSPRFYLCLFSVCSQRGSLKEPLKKSDHSPPLLQTLQEEAKSPQRLVRLAPPVPDPFASSSTSCSVPHTAPHTCPGLCTGGVSCSEHPRSRDCVASLTSSSFQGGLTARLPAALQHSRSPPTLLCLVPIPLTTSNILPCLPTP